VDYDIETANLLHSWCLKYIVGNNANALSVWEHLFLRFCNLIENDESSITSSFDNDTHNWICSIVNQHLDSSVRKSQRLRVNVAEELPLSDWEKWLQDQEQKSAGFGLNLNSTDLALDLVLLIMRMHKTFQLWEKLINRLLPHQQAALITWGYNQAIVAGFPEGVFRVPPFDN